MMRLPSITKLTGACAAVLATGYALVLPAQASAMTIEGAAVPFAIAYASCIYSEPEDADASLPDCGALREELLAEAKPIMLRASPSERLFALRRLRTLFDRMEVQAAKLREESKPVGPEVLSFMECTSSIAREDEDLQRGIFMDGFDAFRECREIYDRYLALDRSTNTVQRNVNYMRNVRGLLVVNRGFFAQIRVIPDDGPLTDRGPSG